MSESGSTALWRGITMRPRGARTAPLRRFLLTESGSAGVLVAAVVAALLWANVDHASYESFWTTRLSISLGDHALTDDLRGWLNSGLMTLFFLVIGLESRREFDLGDLRERRRFVLPVVAGLAGMAVPVSVYLAINAGHATTHGWGIAMSTDTALALGVLALLGSNVPDRARVFLVTVFVVDDLAALVVIALVYSDDLEMLSLLAAALLFGLLRNRPRSWPGPPAKASPRRSRRTPASSRSTTGLVAWGDGRVYAEAPGVGRVRKIRAPEMHGWSASNAASDTAGRRIAAGFERESAEADRYESAVVVWDRDRPARARLRVTVPGTSDHVGIHDFALAPDGNRLYLVADKHAWLRAYDAGSGDLVGVIPAQLNPARDRSQSSIKVSHDGRALIASDGSDVVLMDTQTMDVAARLRGHTARVITMEFSADDRLVAASALDGSTLVWDRSSGELLERLEGVRLPADSLAFSPDSTTLYASVDDTILVWDLAGSRQFVSAVNEPLGRYGYLVVPAPDDRSSAYFRSTITTFGRDTTFDIVTARGRHRPVAASFANWGAYSPSGDTVATVVDRRLQVWDPLDGHLLRETNVPGIRRAEAVTFTPNGSWIVIGDQDGRVQAVDAATLAPVGEQIAVGQHLVDLVAGADGTDVLVLVGPGDAETFPTYAAVDPATGRVDESALRGDVQLNFAAVSPDGRRLAVTSEGLAGLIDLRSGRWISRLADADGEIATRVDFNGDGTRLVTSGLEGRTVLWDGLTGERLAAVQPAGPEFETGLVFLPDGHTAQIAASNGQMFRWDTDPAAWVVYACRVAGRNLGADEWHDVFGSEPYRKTCEEWPSGNES